MKLRIQLLFVLLHLLLCTNVQAQKVLVLQGGATIDASDYSTLSEIGCVPIDGTDFTTQTATIFDTGSGSVPRENARKIEEFLWKMGTLDGLIDATHNGKRGLIVDNDYAIADHNNDDIDVIFPPVEGGGMFCNGGGISSYYYRGAPDDPPNRVVNCRLFHTGDAGDTMIQYRGAGGVFFLNLLGRWNNSNVTEHNNALATHGYAGVLFQLRNKNGAGAEEVHGANLTLSLFGAYARRGFDSPHWHTSGTPPQQGTYQDTCWLPDSFFTCIDNYIVVDEIQSIGHTFGRINCDGTFCDRMITLGSGNVLPLTMNGKFNGNSQTWTAAGGAAYSSGGIATTTGAGSASQTQTGTVANVNYVVKFTTSGVANGGTVTCTLGGTAVGTARSTSGIWIASVPAPSANASLLFTFGGGGTGAVKISGISVTSAGNGGVNTSFTTNGELISSAAGWTVNAPAAYSSGGVFSGGVSTSSGAGTLTQKQMGLQSGVPCKVKFTTSGVASGGTVSCTLGGVTVGSTRSTNGVWDSDILVGPSAAITPELNAPLVFTFGGGGVGAITVDDVEVYSGRDDEGAGTNHSGGGGNVYINWLYHPNGTCIYTGPSWSFTTAAVVVEDFKLDSNFYGANPLIIGNPGVKTLVCDSVFQGARIRLKGTYGVSVDHQMFEVSGNPTAAQPDVQCDIKGMVTGQRAGFPMRRVPGDEWDASTIIPATLATSTKLWVRSKHPETWSPSALIQGSNITTIDDYSAANNDLTTGVSPTFVKYSSNWNPGVFFGGGSSPNWQHLKNTTATGLTALDAFTIMMVFRETATAVTAPPRPDFWNSYQCLISCSGNPATAATGVTIFIELGTGRVMCRCKGIDVITSNAIYLERPNILLISRNTSGAIQIRLNGILSTGTTTSGVIPTAAGPLTLGAMANGGTTDVTFPFKGEINEVIWDDAYCDLSAYTTDTATSTGMTPFFFSRLQYLRAMYGVW